MPSKLGKYTLVRTLGTGANSKVKLALDSKTGQYFAVKVMKKANSTQDKKMIELVVTEVQTMKQLQHLNIVNLIEFNQEGVLEKSDGSKRTVFYIVLELASGGELFDFVAQTGAFSEPVARYYFQQLIEGLEYVHRRGITHRDLKPENLLFDSEFHLKIADFGFAAPLSGRDGTYNLKTVLGTFGYMAPEIILRQPYHGDSVDLFAAAVILFIMVARHPPFNKADPRDDKFYKMLVGNRPDLFWGNHSYNKPGKENYFSAELKNLITFMLQLDPTHRLSIQDIKAHQWYNGPVPTYQEICHEFKKRKEQLDREAQIQEQQKQQQKQAASTGKSRYRSDKNRDDEEEEEDMKVEEQKFDSAFASIDPYIAIANRGTELFSDQTPEELMTTLKQCLEKNGIQWEQAKNQKYKLYMKATSPEGDQIEMVAKMLKVNDKTNCLEFNKKSGDKIQFYDHFYLIKKVLGCVAANSDNEGENCVDSQ